ncbi:hypothetical protein PF005_g24123 [Phytophthora fragariae]|uniref:LicD family protein n=1 Tax=Phytophthora fragariae TaxID=53985 RepID=A0A6A3RJT7_9STRA|nr:hypothetical protein PF003_g2935 [Phytophthora fragariae]KAE8924850.1 hypothetical protein PF009_g24924 [Phytophthora fragariae]KAE8978863.1 hypothetical protein PF011_g23072 [Phytophthora fragariae]KAE9077290.1 hypothetical protein PF010_g23566 [Phytophthora fragariae]KAE9077703.1 hypothetical protein PF007_g24141 [Phytophthora fragariae]
MTRRAAVCELEDARHAGTPKSIGRRRKCLCTLLTVIPIFALLLTGLVILDIILETNLVARTPASVLLNYQGFCEPKSVNASKVEYHSDHIYYTELQNMGHIPEPVFHDDHTSLCSEWSRSLKKYSHCLPISGRKDTPFCESPDRLDLLTLRSSKSICFASVLHMLLVEVYEELQATGNTPFLAFGSLLGAVRNQSMIPFTEDADIGFIGELQSKDALKDALLKKGYHMFHMNITSQSAAEPADQSPDRDEDLREPVKLAPLPWVKSPSY